MTFRPPRTHEEARRAATLRQNEREDILSRGQQRQALEWAARWVEQSASGKSAEVVAFAENMAMTIRAEARGDKLTKARSSTDRSK